MNADLLDQLRQQIQRDVNRRGLDRDPHDNLFTACRDDFAHACRNIAESPRASLGVVTGFFIPHAQPPCGETDGPLGALFLARAFSALDIPIVLFTDSFCLHALEVGTTAAGVSGTVATKRCDDETNLEIDSGLTHLIAVERVGPSYDGRCRNMRGRDVTGETAPAHRLFDGLASTSKPIVTIGIGDGGNEIGMGKIAPSLIARDIEHGESIACRVPTDYLLVAGVSNWGAYALAAGVAYLRRRPLPASLFDRRLERELLRRMVEDGPLVDGVTAIQSATVDGLTFDEYIEPLDRIGELLRNEGLLR